MSAQRLLYLSAGPCFFFFLSFSRTCYELSIAVGAEGEAGRKQNLYVRGAGGH